jgi:hypothetical protein
MKHMFSADNSAYREVPTPREPSRSANGGEMGKYCKQCNTSNERIIGIV